ncbi:MAG: hypothetical protein JO121_14005 [Deltaproteobacteria bacterium]|nr:hypothetical protein [Deltaproteobacteria bacterium]
MTPSPGAFERSRITLSNPSWRERPQKFVPDPPGGKANVRLTPFGVLTCTNVGNAEGGCLVARDLDDRRRGVRRGEPLCPSRASRPSCMMRSHMRLTHIAALAAASWYLLVPMFDPKSGKVVPLAISEWNEEGIFDSEKDCLNAKRSLVEEYRMSGAAPRVQNIVSAQAACVASDDPRLQGKVPFSLGPPPPPPR